MTTLQTQQKRKPSLPELLCPAGTFPALEAAIEGGADAVYLGGQSMNARMHAGNFSDEELIRAVRLAHLYGVKVYLTLNTLVTDRELPGAVKAASFAAEAGVDALIVADLGCASAIRRALPELELHASTQASGHNAAMGEELKKLGFSRMVLAREISEENLFRTVRECPIETEIFVHGALCVCHSGQCLFSSLVGGRSGNRGECAQPCRLPYALPGGKNRTGYPLSLKDLSLAGHIPAIISAGVTSLKIEGRMKSPEYVRDTARVFRTLLDENRAATEEELFALSGVFSRSGLTDGYFTGKIGHSMLGVRSDADKANSRTLNPFLALERKIPLSVSFFAHTGEKIALTLTGSDGETLTVTGDAPEAARTTPTTKEQVARAVGIFGGTPFSIGDFSCDLSEGVLVPVSAIKELRRRALEEWESAHTAKKPVEKRPATFQAERLSPAPTRSAAFRDPGQITEAAEKYFDRIYLPLFSHTPAANGVILPPVIFDGDADRVKIALTCAKKAGAQYALVGNVGHLSLVKNAGLIPMGDYRLNIWNRESAAALASLGFTDPILSPELSLPQIRDLGGGVTVYGRIPLMTLEKCVGSEISDCKACASNRVTLTDRRGVSFPVLREWEHRSVIVNSVPTGMSDRAEELDRAGVRYRHFLFTVESPAEVDRVIRAFETGAELPFPVRRIRS